MVKLLALAALTSAVAAQSLTSVLAENNSTLSALSSLLGNFPSLVSTLSSARNITILAPSNNALETLLNSSTGKTLSSNPGLTQAILQYHVLNGTYYASAITNTSAFVPTLLTNTSYTNVTGGQVVNAVLSDGNVTFFTGLNQNVSVQTANVNFTGGVIHVIDGVLTLPENASTTAVAANLTALAGALTKANLVETVDTLRDVTIFAPTNAAFENIGSALPNLTAEELTSILEYHVINGTVAYSTDLSNNQKVPTVGGGEVTIRIDNGTVFVNGAEVVTPDVLIANGVVHVIDNVLNPSNTTASPTASATAGNPAFSGASSVSSIALTSGVMAPSSTIGGGAAESSSSSSGLAAPMRTGAVGAAALFGAGAIMANF